MMPTNFQAFNRDLEQTARKLYDEELVPFYKKIGITALGKLIIKTPVDTGRAHGNWQVAVDQTIDSQVDRTSGVQALREGTQQIAALSEFQTIYLVNNVPYITALERGHSRQAPKGMVSGTIDEMRQMFGG